jgi:dihydrofolate synthase/folylpolyglutamate synthase
LAILGLLRVRLPGSSGAIRDGLVGVELAGRFQVLPGRPAIVLDVAHNPHAARALDATLGAMGFFPRTIAVFGMLADKDIAGVAAVLRARIDVWCVATLPGARGASARADHDALIAAGVAETAIRGFDNVEIALAAARKEASEADRIIVFGSFLTVAAALAAVQSDASSRHG